MVRSADIAYLSGGHPKRAHPAYCSRSLYRASSPKGETVPCGKKYGSPRGPVPMVGERCVSQRSPRHGLLAVRMGVDWSPRLISFQTGIFSGRESAANSPGRAHQAMTLTFPWTLEDIVGSLTHDRWLKGLERSSAKPFRSITTVMSA